MNEKQFTRVRAVFKEAATNDAVRDALRSEDYEAAGAAAGVELKGSDITYLKRVQASIGNNFNFGRFMDDLRQRLGPELLGIILAMIPPWMLPAVSRPGVPNQRQPKARKAGRRR